MTTDLEDKFVAQKYIGKEVFYLYQLLMTLFLFQLMNAYSLLYHIHCYTYNLYMYIHIVRSLYFVSNPTLFQIPFN